VLNLTNLALPKLSTSPLPSPIASAATSFSTCPRERRRASKSLRLLGKSGKIHGVCNSWLTMAIQLYSHAVPFEIIIDSSTNLFLWDKKKASFYWDHPALLVENGPDDFQLKTWRVSTVLPLVSSNLSLQEIFPCQAHHHRIMQIWVQIRSVSKTVHLKIADSCGSSSQIWYNIHFSAIRLL